MATREDFIKHEISIWGEDYIFDLLERGYVVRLTSDGYKWFYTEPALDNSGTTCYAGAVGAS